MGGIPKIFSFMQFSQNINGFRQNDSQGFQYSYNSKPIRETFHFHYLPKPYIGFKVFVNSNLKLGAFDW